MNVSQYTLSDKLAQDAIASLSLFASIEESVVAAGRSASNALESQRHADGETASVGGTTFTYFVDRDGGTCIAGCTSDESTIEVPPLIQGHPVTSVGGHAFSTCYPLQLISLPDTVEAIGRYAFMNCGLREFTAPQSLRFIGENAFYKCTGLKKVMLNDRLATIGSNAFRESALSEVRLPASVEFVGQNAFKGTDVALGANPTLTIDPENDSLFLEGGTLYASNHGRGLTLIQAIDEEMTAFSGLEGTVFVASKAFANLPALEHATLPEGTLGVGDKAFMGCRALTHVTLPNSLRSIGKQVFQDTSLCELKIPESLAEVGAGVFYTGGSIAHRHTPTIKHVSIHPGNTSFFMADDILCHRNAKGGVTALLYVGNAEHLVVPRQVTSIGMYAFLNCSSIKSVEIHDGLESIDVGGLDTGRSITSVIYDVYDGHDNPQQRYLVSYPPGQAGREAAKQTFSRGRFDLAHAFEAADDAVFATQDACLRGKAILERLGNPVFLSDSTRAAFIRRLKRGVPATVVAFGRNGFPQGIDRLYEEGVIHQDNIDELIEAASDANEIAVLSRLLELKRTAFGASMLDFDL